MCAGLDPKADRTATGRIQEQEQTIYSPTSIQTKTRLNTISNTGNHNNHTDKKVKEQTCKNILGANLKTRHSWSRQGTKRETLGQQISSDWENSRQSPLKLE